MQVILPNHKVKYGLNLSLRVGAFLNYMITGNEPITYTPKEASGLENNHGYIKPDRGLTKREYFAAKAMQGICGCVVAGGSDNHYTVNGGWLHPETVAKAAVEISDALINALNESVTL